MTYGSCFFQRTTPSRSGALLTALTQASHSHDSLTQENKRQPPGLQLGSTLWYTPSSKSPPRTVGAGGGEVRWNRAPAKTLSLLGSSPALSRVPHALLLPQSILCAFTPVLISASRERDLRHLNMQVPKSHQQGTLTNREKTHLHYLCRKAFELESTEPDDEHLGCFLLTSWDYRLQLQLCSCGE